MRKKVSLCKIHKGLHALTVSPYRDILDHQARTAWTYSFSQSGKGVWLFALWFLCFLVSARLLSSNEWLLRCGQVCCFWVLTCFYRGDTPSPGLGREDMQKLQMTQGWEEPGCTDTCIRHALPLTSWLISLIHRQNELTKCLKPVSVVTISHSFSKPEGITFRVNAHIGPNQLGGLPKPRAAAVWCHCRTIELLKAPPSQ